MTPAILWALIISGNFTAPATPLGGIHATVQGSRRRLRRLRSGRPRQTVFMAIDRLRVIGKIEKRSACNGLRPVVPATCQPLAIPDGCDAAVS
jgi:hypothetical protein